MPGWIRCLPIVIWNIHWEKKDTRNLGAAGGPWSEIVSRKGGVVFYFYEEKYMGKSDSVRAANVLVRKFYTSVELDSLDWTVIYP